ncbi:MULTISPECIES: type II secretion system secretin GspD [unclassified Pseudomonas]|uniref:type II secretion system secretin GspD n=1 Tax=unclassified Pseudomonas TaxID=196821 RepID=UPI000689082C|nr:MULTISPECIES: type II secretion system secretin GspD [unclassified Pseudomonas]
MATATLLAGCISPATDTQQDDALLREGLAGTGSQRPLVREPSPNVPSSAETGDNPRTPARSQIIRGDNRFINSRVTPAAKPSAAPDGGVVFNFNNQPIRAVINSILGDLLQVNYTIAQDVKGEVTFSTSKPVAKTEALSILETLLSWTNNALVREGDRYMVVPANQAVAGRMVPALQMPEPGSGLSARLFQLDYISATEMQKLLKPFARENAFLLVDPSRNVIALAGTPDELANYQRTISTFDVNWLKGMSIGVFGLQRASVAELMPELDRLFGPQSGTPLAGMLRFLPIERTNAVVAISSQPEYLNEVRQWIETIDKGGGNEPQMYVYDVRNMKATDLARYLRQIYSNEAVSEEPEAQVAPGLRTTTLSTGTNTSTTGTTGITGSSQGLGGLGSNGLSTSIGSNSGIGGGNTGNSTTGNRNASDTDNENSNSSASGGSDSNTNDAGVRITAQKSSNQLLIRTRPSQWNEIQSAIKRLDNAPMQVQIETRVLEVSLTGSLSLGVQWYLGHLAGNSSTEGIANTSGSQGALGQGGAALSSSDALFYSFVSNNLQVALHVLETNGNTRVLSAPSLVVMNNQQAQIQVGDNIPITQTSVSTTSDSTFSSVQYVQTGVILDVVPRINPGGLVYMDIQQQVSDASSTTDANGNPSISTRAVTTQVAVQSGQTVLLGGLIQQSEAETDNSVPYLSRIPGLHWLFGSTARNKGRSELIVLITPRVITSNSQASQITDEYRQQLQLISPIKPISQIDTSR